jgi:hypothetical protein
MRNSSRGVQQRILNLDECRACSKSLIQTTLQCETAEDGQIVRPMRLELAADGHELFADGLDLLSIEPQQTVGESDQEGQVG